MIFFSHPYQKLARRQSIPLHSISKRGSKRSAFQKKTDCFAWYALVRSQDSPATSVPHTCCTRVIARVPCIPPTHTSANCVRQILIASFWPEMHRRELRSSAGLALVIALGTVAARALCS